MNNIRLGEMIDYYRKKNGWTMKQLGEKMNKTESAISLWISNKRSPMVEDLDKLAKLFDVSPETLMFGNTISSIIEETVTTMKQLEKKRQKLVLRTASEQLKEQNKNLKKPKNIVPLKKEQLTDQELWKIVEQGVSSDNSEQQDYEKEFFFNLLKKSLNDSNNSN